MLSCEPGEISNEHVDLQGGVFTAHLIEALSDPELLDQPIPTLWAWGVAQAVRDRVAKVHAHRLRRQANAQGVV